MKVICISGHAQHGKDTSAVMMKELLESDGYRVLITHYGDLLKYICKAFFDWNGEKDLHGRTLLQFVGTDVIRAKAPDFWVAFVAYIIKEFQSTWDYVLIPDCRFPNEVHYMSEAGFDTVHLRVVRQNFASPLTPEQQQHPSETALDHVMPDYYINNYGTLDDLRHVISNLLPEIIGFHQMTFDELRGKLS